VSRRIPVPPALERKARAEGDACVSWLDHLGDLVRQLEQEWNIHVGDAMSGGTASFVAPAKMADGRPVVLKVAMPAAIDGLDALTNEARALRAADGRGCVRLLAQDPSRGALLVEMLGPRLADTGLPLPDQLDIICETLQRFWAAPADAALPSGADKARWLASFIATEWEALGRPCPRRTIDHAIDLAGRRADDFDPARGVLVHGDAHVWNTLEDPAAPGRYRFVDPDGLFAEPEYDLGISMREYGDEFLAGDPVARGRRRAEFLARRTGRDERRIWEWGYIERVSTGLLLIKVDKDAAGGLTFLDIAAAWAGE
jgi:streptomycin 6-kinase